MTNLRLMPRRTGNIRHVMLPTGFHSGAQTLFATATFDTIHPKHDSW